MVIFKQFIIDEYKIPILIINLEKQNKTILNIPTQIGCPINCSFCPSSQQKLVRNLTSSELINIVHYALKFSTTNNNTLSFTGEGEIYLNKKNVQETINYFDHIESIKDFRVCTSGIKINSFSSISAKKELNLQFSLHSPFDEKRKTIIDKTRNINDIIFKIKENENGFNNISINYVLIKGFNDTENDLKELIKIIPNNWKIKLNSLIKDENNDFQESKKGEYFYNTLSENGYSVFLFNKIANSIEDKFFNKLTYEKSNSFI